MVADVDVDVDAADLLGREAVVVEAVVPRDAVQHLQIAANQIVAVRVDERNVRLLGVVGAKLARHALLLQRAKECGLHCTVNAECVRIGLTPCA